MFAMPTDRFKLNDILLLSKCRGKDFIGNCLTNANKNKPQRVLWNNFCKNLWFLFFWISFILSSFLWDSIEIIVVELSEETLEML